MTTENSVAVPSPLQKAGALRQDCPGTATRDALSQPGKPVTPVPLLLLLKWVLYLAAILLLPGALIGVPLLWWLDRRRTRANPSPPKAELDKIVHPCGRCG